MTAVLAFRPTTRRLSCTLDAMFRAVRENVPPRSRWCLITPARGEVEINVDLTAGAALAFFVSPSRRRRVLEAVNSERDGGVFVLVRFRWRGFVFASRRLPMNPIVVRRSA